MAGPLKLRARDRDDLSVIAACLQDSLIPMAELAYLPAENRFVIVANRFLWEDAVADTPNEAPGQAVYGRVHCGVCFDGVTAVRHQGINRTLQAAMLSLLTVKEGDGTVDLIFAEGGVIRLEVERILCHLEDLSEAWPTQWRPSHDLDDAG